MIICRTIFALTSVLVILIGSTSFALPPESHLAGKRSVSDVSGDLTTFFDANNLLVFVTDIGSVGMDHSRLFDRFAGFYYPFSGDTSDIRNGTQDKTVVYAAGLILAGKVGGEVRTAVAAYDFPEYVPGPMAGGTFLPHDSSFRVYSIDNTSGPGDPDYDDWPDSLGAPVDQFGNPLKLGEQTLWAVFNDADPSLHNNYFGGGTTPLGVEVQQTVWGGRDPGEENVLHVQYKLYNKGFSDIDSFYILFWADPDIGGANDDLVGCDSVHDIFFCYNADDYDGLYGGTIPAWGGKVVSGPILYSPGDTAIFDRGLLPNHRNIRMSSFIKYVNGTEPDDPEELYLYAKGWDAKNAVPLTNPYTGDSTTFYAPGDPLTRKGWFNENPSDARILVGFGPLSFNPGDSQQVVLKLGAYFERDRRFSLSVLRNILDPGIPVDSVMDTVSYIESDSVQIAVTDFGLDKVYFTPLKQRWFKGLEKGGNYFGGGADYACNFAGSYLDPTVHPDSFHSVEIRFSREVVQNAYRYDKQAGSYLYAGYYDVPFTVWDIDNNRQLNAAFVEYAGSDTYDFTWGPDVEENDGGWKMLFIFNSDYSGAYPYNPVVDYRNYDIIGDADSLDILYFVWPALMEGYSLSDLADGQKLNFRGQFVNANGIIDTLYFRKIDVGNATGQIIDISCFSSGPCMLGLETSDRAAFQLSSSVLRFVENTEQRISVNFTPYRIGQYDERLYVIDSTSGEIRRIVHLSAATNDVTGVVDNPPVVSATFSLSQNYPNPFNPVTAIDFTLPNRSQVTVTIYNLLGRKVTRLFDGVRSAGKHTVFWDGTDSKGQPVASGVYFYRIEARRLAATRKMILLR